MQTLEMNKLNLHLQLALGRITALQTFCYVIARQLPLNIAQSVYDDLATTGEMVIAGAVASPIPDAHFAELTKVTDELRFILDQSIRTLSGDSV